MKDTIRKIDALSILAENINPTNIYNEGWMIRLLVIESMIEGLNLNGIDFKTLKSKTWSSEALIKSPFVEAGKYREGYTHTDIILGDFTVAYDDGGEVKLSDNKGTKILGIIEAKMRSNLSQGTTNAKNYNQASRNVCCLAYTTKDFSNCEIFFLVVAPETTIKKHRIESQIDKQKIESQIRERFEHSKEEYLQLIKERVESCKILSISYEEWIKQINDKEVKEALVTFYNKCKSYNKV